MTKKYTRGEFLGFGAALAGAYGAGRLAPPPAAPPPRPPAAQPLEPQPPPAATNIEPDLVVVNAVVYTSDPAQPRADAFAIKSGRFVAIGTTRDVRNLATARTPIIDAQRMTITPGFIDAHCHPSGVEELYGVNCNLRTVAGRQAAVRM